MELFVYSRLAIERCAPFDEPHVFISITTTPEERARLPENEHTLGVLRLAFLDKTAPPGDVFTDRLADEIISFIEGHVASGRGLSAVVVHCDAGRSRSPGVAAALARGVFGQDDAALFRRYVPNRLVYRSLLAASTHPEVAIDRWIGALGTDAKLGAPFTAEEIAKLEFLIGCPLPRAYRHFLSRWGSLTTGRLSLLPFPAIVEATETIQSLDDGAGRTHRVLVFAAGHAFDFRVESDFGEPEIVDYAPAAGVDAFARDPEADANAPTFAAWLATR